MHLRLFSFSKSSNYLQYLKNNSLPKYVKISLYSCFPVKNYFIHLQSGATVWTGCSLGFSRLFVFMVLGFPFAMFLCLFIFSNILWLTPFFFFFVFLGPHPWHIAFPRLGVQLELWLPAYATATAMLDRNCICNLHHSWQQCWILNPPREARDRIFILMDTSQVC